MTKQEFIDTVHKSMDGRTKKETAEVVQATFDAVVDAIKDDGKFTYPGFGTFYLKERAARQGRNPQTGQRIRIPPSKSVNFKPSAGLKDSL